jgi:hypothetical protein
LVNAKIQVEGCWRIEVDKSVKREFEMVTLHEAKMADRRPQLSKSDRELLAVLQARFEENAKRHKGLKWVEVEMKLLANPAKLSSLHWMEASGGEPDVVGNVKSGSIYRFVDCSAESPKGRRSLCFDGIALEARKQNKPSGSALDLAVEMGCELLTEQQYRELQTFGEFDLKTSSWIATPPDIRKLGGALFCDRRFGHVFVYHNGAQSYYADRGFRCQLELG